MKSTDSSAFKVLFNSCLNCVEGEQIAVIFDESTEKFIPSLVDAAIQLNLILSLNYLPKIYQLSLIERNKLKETKFNLELPTGTALSIGESESIITLINDDLRTNRLRRAILDENRASGAKLAHIPGFSKKILSIIKETDFQSILSDAENLAWALGQSKSAVLITQALSGEIFELRMDLGGWKNEPIMSTGVILPNSWGNVPPGEVFCCPDHKHVNGKICINGSLPSLPLNRDEEVVLNFENGRLVELLACSNKNIEAFFNEEEEKAKKRGDNFWNAFAELGIGLNRSVKTLTGINVFDEKRYGTIHIAIGDNEIFGHGLRSFIHADMVTIRPSLKLDDKLIINKGEIDVDTISEWRADFEFKKYAFMNETRIKLNRIKMYKEKGIFYRKLHKKNRIGLIRIAEQELAMMYSCLTDNLDEIEDKYYIDIKENAEEDYLKRTNYKINDLLNVLKHYEIVELMG